jgi:hypothetical protein
METTTQGSSTNHDIYSPPELARITHSKHTKHNDFATSGKNMELCFSSQQQEIFVLSKASGSAVGPTQ